MSNKAQKPKRLNATEALYAFTAWLTTRDKPVILGAHHNAAVLPPLVEAFRTKHDLPEVRNNYGDLIHSMGAVLENATNDPALATNQCARMYNAQEALDVILPIVRGLTPAAQTTVMAKLFLHVKDQHADREKQAWREIGEAQDKRTKEQTFLATLDKIAKGEVVII